MDEIIHKHRLRDIKYAIDPSIAISEQERAFLAVYFGLHDRTLDIKRQPIIQKNAATDLIARIWNLADRLGDIQSNFNFMENHFGIRKHAELSTKHKHHNLDVEGFLERMQIFAAAADAESLDAKEGWVWYVEISDLMQANSSWHSPHALAHVKNFLSWPPNEGALSIGLLKQDFDIFMRIEEAILEDIKAIFNDIRKTDKMLTEIYKKAARTLKRGEPLLARLENRSNKKN